MKIAISRKVSLLVLFLYPYRITGFQGRYPFKPEELLAKIKEV